jgi:hypothetical protein
MIHILASVKGGTGRGAREAVGTSEDFGTFVDAAPNKSKFMEHMRQESGFQKL